MCNNYAIHLASACYEWKILHTCRQSNYACTCTQSSPSVSGYWRVSFGKPLSQWKERLTHEWPTTQRERERESTSVLDVHLTLKIYLKGNLLLANCSSQLNVHVVIILYMYFTCANKFVFIVWPQWWPHQVMTCTSRQSHIYVISTRLYLMSPNDHFIIT